MNGSTVSCRPNPVQLPPDQTVSLVPFTDLPLYRDPSNSRSDQSELRRKHDRPRTPPSRQESGTSSTNPISTSSGTTTPRRGARMTSTPSKASATSASKRSPTPRSKKCTAIPAKRREDTHWPECKEYFILDPEDRYMRFFRLTADRRYRGNPSRRRWHYPLKRPSRLPVPTRRPAQTAAPGRTRPRRNLRRLCLSRLPGRRQKARSRHSCPQAG